MKKQKKVQTRGSKKRTNGLEKALGMILADRPAYSAKTMADKTVEIEFFNGAVEIFRSGDFADNFRNQSFRGEGRAYSELCGMKERIDSVRAHTQTLVSRTTGMSGEIQARFDSFATRHIEFSLAYIRNNSRLASAMITGPSNFPMRRQQKLNDAHHDKYTRLTEHLKLSMKALNKVAFPHGDPRNGIRSDNPEAALLLEKKIAHLETQQAYYKKANADTRKAMKHDAPEAYLLQAGYSEQEAKEFVSYDYTWMKNRAFGAYVTTNNLANIKRLKSRLAGLQRIESKGSCENEIQTNIGKVNYVENTEIMRVQFVFDGKPALAVRSILKAHGFRWSPKNTAWQRQLTNNGKYSANLVVKKLEEMEV